jgi:hypothetical protein
MRLACPSAPTATSCTATAWSRGRSPKRPTPRGCGCAGRDRAPAACKRACKRTCKSQLGLGIMKGEPIRLCARQTARPTRSRTRSKAVGQLLICRFRVRVPGGVLRLEAMSLFGTRNESRRTRKWCGDDPWHGSVHLERGMECPLPARWGYPQGAVQRALGDTPVGSPIACPARLLAV